MKNNLTKYSILFCLTVWSGHLCAQSNYFGSRYAVQFSIDAIPSFRKKVIYSEVNNQTSKKLRIANTNYCLSVTNYNGKQVESLYGIEYSKIRMYTQGVQINSINSLGTSSGGFNYQVEDDFDVLNDPVINYFGFRYENKIYTGGNNAPFGFYFGYRVKAGMGKFTPSNSMVIGHTGALLDSSSLVQTYDAPIVDDYFNEDLYEDSRMIMGFIHAILGRSFPLTHKITLNVTASFPILYAQYYDFNSNVGIFPYFDFKTENPEPIVSLTDNAWYSVVNRSVNKYNGPALEFAIRFHL
ncbi:MAG: hypothetical protein ACI857_000348 [Arenicella sp.]